MAEPHKITRKQHKALVVEMIEIIFESKVEQRSLTEQETARINEISELIKDCDYSVNLDKLLGGRR